MASFLIPKKKLVCFVSLLLFSFTFYTEMFPQLFLNWSLKLERIIEPDLNTAICQPETNLAFIKTHKTGSSSLFHVFIRFADKYQRLLGFFKDMFILKKFNRKSLLSLKPGYKYNVFAQHTIFDYEEMRAVMPNDTKYITILRDPVTQFQSLYNYMFMELYNGMNISTFANLNISHLERAKFNKERIGSYGINQMAFDLGMDPSLFDDENAILEKVQELDEQFDLVMIAEFYDESVILMKEKLCWQDWNDVISFKLNVIKSDYKARLSSEQKENLRRINRADQLIYDHFYQKLLGQIDAFGKEKMEEEVGKLREATKKMYDLCVDDDHNNNNNSVNENQNLDDLFSLKLKKAAESDQLCRDLTTNFHHLMMNIVAKQKAFYGAESAISLGLIEAKLLYAYYSILRDIHSFIFRNNLVKVTRELFAHFI